MRVCVIGAGPVGVETALALLQKDFSVSVLESGMIGSGIRAWQHVKVFSPWRMNTSKRGRECLGENFTVDLDAFPTGQQLIEKYLEPICNEILKDRVHTFSKVLSVGRRHKTKNDENRGSTPFVVLVENAKDGTEKKLEFDVVIDCSGVQQHNHLGNGGIRALGEKEAIRRGFVDYAMPTPEQCVELRGKKVCVIGSGFSAATTLKTLTGDDGISQIQWLTRKSDNPYMLVENDPLAERDELSKFGNSLASAQKNDGKVRHVGDCYIEAFNIAKDGKTVDIVLENGTVIRDCERIFANVGYKPDLDIFRELQVHQCYASEGPMKLHAALGGHGKVDCLKQMSYGAETLLNPEPNFFIIGSKSYGRLTSFLLTVGHNQVEELVEILTKK